MSREEQRATAIQRRLDAYEEELNQTYDEDLSGFSMEALRTELQEQAEAIRDQHIATLLKDRREELERMSDEELLKDDDEE